MAEVEIATLSIKTSDMYVCRGPHLCFEYYGMVTDDFFLIGLHNWVQIIFSSCYRFYAPTDRSIIGVFKF